MAITKKSEQRIEIPCCKTIEIETTTIIEEDGVELSRGIHRRALMPGEDVSGESHEVQAIADVLWTPIVIEAYQVACHAHPSEAS